MYQKLENLSLWVIKIGVVLCLFVPLIIYVGVPYPNIFPKTIFFRTVVEVLFVFYIFLILFKPKTYLPKFSFLSLSVLVFISVLTVSSILGINPYRSFWGTLVRGEGLITYFHLLWFFIIVMGVFDNKKSHSCGYKSLSDLNGFFSSRNSLFSNFKSFISQVPLRLTKLRKKIDWFFLFSITAFVSFLVSVTLLVQKFGIFSFYSQDPSRPSGTLGNPDFVPGVLIFGIFLGIFLIKKSKKKITKAIFGLIILMNLFVLFLTKTRSGWIGAGLGFSFLIISFLVYSFKQNKFSFFRKLILSLVLILLLLFFGISLIQNIPEIEENPYFIRIFSLLNYKKVLKTRLVAWETAIDGFRKRPIIGWGQESFNFVYDKHFKTKHLSVFPDGRAFDRAHNKILQLLVVSGILGALSYILIFVLIFYYLFRSGSRFKNFDSFCLGALFLGYFVQNLFIFDILSSYIFFLLVLGFINNFVTKEKEEREKEEKLKLKKLKTVIIFLIIVFVGFTFYEVNLKPFLSASLFIEGVNQTGRNCTLSSENFQKSFKYNTYLNPELGGIGARHIFSVFNEIKDKECREIMFNDSLLFRDAIKQGVQTPNIKYAGFLRVLGRLNEDLYLLSGDLQYLTEAEKILKKALKFKNQQILVYRSLGRLKMWQNKEKEGLEFYKKALFLNLNLGSLFKFHKRLATVYRELEKPEKEEYHLKRAKRVSYVKNYPDLYSIFRLAEIQRKAGNIKAQDRLFKEATEQYKKAIKIREEKGQEFKLNLYADLASIYNIMGKKEEAERVVREILKKAPHLESDVQRMLKTIEEN